MSERRGRSKEEEIQPVDLSTPQPVDEVAETPAEKAGGRGGEKKVKVTFCLDEATATLIDSVASEMRVPSSRLVEKVMLKALRGCRRPTIPGELRTMFSRKERSAV